MRKIYFAPFIILLMLADQFSKWWVIEVFLRPRVFEAKGATTPFGTWLTTFTSDLFPRAVVPVWDIFNISMAWNKGVSFSMLASTSDMMPYILSGLALAMVAGLLVWLARSTTAVITAVPLAMVIAGALSNVWDRVRFGAVADFLDFHVGDWHYATFNIADCCIVVGVAGLALDGLFLEPRRRKENPLKGEKVTS